jgi:hypothetical protein
LQGNAPQHPAFWQIRKRETPRSVNPIKALRIVHGRQVSAECLAMLAERGISLGLDVYGTCPALRNIQIIDGANNATFSVFQATDIEFAQIFPAADQDMEIANDFVHRVGEAQAKLTFDAICERPILKRDANGIHGTLYFNYDSKRRHMPRSKREVDLDERSINDAQRKLFAEWRYSKR